ncbi:AAA family ATPase [Corynebacterium casei]|uniref:ATPase AAA-type core domain-containing protein n=2 Tax=Corynebacterium casei TaxID=160386 RepID=G7I210_9CORY|nr:ATP-binding protein [Corynebacterium casei]AHI18718.1 hypothetical protein CCASEI_00665 [Corynebacterium casei LMG S-19264]MDN5729990.1 ATP-binding protein [Corynebacterium casei]MDN5741610.1 ATP-binding protein [Corynebacterium casei]MDN5799850.1 ATP-binding protein [Corynebacterium casei]MDN5827294.1 ATP-binding protein [Corynebacterium casei]
MLLELTVGNYRSFREKTTFSMISSKEQKFRERLPRLEKRYQLSVTPIAAVFGANASGKSNLVNALSDLRKLLHDPPRSGEPLPYRPFKLDPSSLIKPTYLEALFSLDDRVYEYSIEYDRKTVVNEKLIQHLSRTEKVIFERNGATIDLGKSISSEKLETYIEGIPENVPTVAFFGSSLNSSVPHSELLTAPYKWTRRTLTLPAGVFDPSAEAISFIPGLHIPIPDDVLKAVDLGICGIKRQPVEFSSLQLTESIEDYLRQQYNEDDVASVETMAGRFEISKDANGKLTANRIRLLHIGSDGEYPLEWHEESDGTKSIIRLLGIFVTLAIEESPLLLVIDELDRSFHTELSRALIDGFLATCSADSRAQLLFTTHDLLLMDPDRLRRDEMWVVEKDNSGSSMLIGVAEYREARKDLDLRKSYLAGRFGGVPSIKPLGLSQWAERLTEVENG